MKVYYVDWTDGSILEIEGELLHTNRTGNFQSIRLTNNKVVAIDYPPNYSSNNYSSSRERLIEVLKQLTKHRISFYDSMIKLYENKTVELQREREDLINKMNLT